MEEDSLTSKVGNLLQPHNLQCYYNEGKINDKGMHQTYLNFSHSLDWILDSRAIDHMATCKDLLFNIRYDNPSTMHIANGSAIKIIGYKYAYISTNITMHNILYVSECKSNLLSVSKLAVELNWCIIFGEKAMKIGDCEANCGVYSISTKKNKGKSRHVNMSVNSHEEALV